MTMVLNLNCCGLKELASIQDYFHDKETGKVVEPKDDTPMKECISTLVKHFAKHSPVHVKTPFGTWTGQSSSLVDVLINPAHIIFSDAHEAHGVRYGQHLKEYIEKNSLGIVIQSEKRHNNNYRNVKHHDIICYVWSPDEKAIAAFAKKEFPELFSAEDNKVGRDKELKKWVTYAWVGNLYSYAHTHANRSPYLTKFDPKSYGFTDGEAAYKELSDLVKRDWDGRKGLETRIPLKDFLVFYGYDAAEPVHA